MEAMKMENELRTQSGGVVKAVLVAPGRRSRRGRGSSSSSSPGALRARRPGSVDSL
jgi:hypothetical protein